MQLCVIEQRPLSQTVTFLSLCAPPFLSVPLRAPFYTYLSVSTLSPLPATSFFIVSYLQYFPFPTSLSVLSPILSSLSHPLYSCLLISHFSFPQLMSPPLYHPPPLLSPTPSYLPLPIFLFPSPASLNPLLFHLSSVCPTHPSFVLAPPSILLFRSLLVSCISPLCIPSSSQGKRISKSMSMNMGPCQGMAVGLKTLSHSDSYTWAVENRRPSTAKSFHRDGSISSLGSQDLSFPDIYTDNCVHTESQVPDDILNIRLPS